MNSIQPELFLVMLKIIQLRFVNTSTTLLYCNEWLLRTNSGAQSEKPDGMRLFVNPDTPQHRAEVQPAHAQGLYKNDEKSFEVRKIRHLADDQ